MTTQQTEALQCAADLEYSIARHGMQDAFTLNAYRAMKMVRTQLARITELESQLAQRFDAADMATAAAQGFRDWVASVSAGSELVAWKHDCAALLANDVELWIDACPHCGKPCMHATQAAHPYPKEGMAGWMPIETAPKDGSRILLHPAVEVADDWSKGNWNSEHKCWIVGGSSSGVVHTAWHPLPTAPSTEGESNV